MEDGDVVWLDYTSEIKGNPDEKYPGQTAENWAVKIGSGGFYAEDKLIGQKCGPSTKIEFEHEFAKDHSNAAIAGKTLIFSVDILKVKTHKVVLEARELKAKELEEKAMEKKDAKPE